MIYIFNKIEPNFVTFPIEYDAPKGDDYKIEIKSNTNQVIDMHISYGYAIFDDALDSDLEKTRDRADAFMYENKRKSKETP